MQKDFAPFVRVTNSSDELVLEGVTRFKYVHSEKVDDATYITIESDNADLADHPDFQEKSKIFVTWGYIGGVSQKRLVYIWDIRISFETKGIRIEYECYCKAAFMKLNSSKDVYNDTGLDDMAQTMADAYGLNLKTENISEDEQKPTDYYTKQIGGKTQSQFDVGPGQFSTAIDNTANVVSIPLRRYPEGIPQANRSDKKLLDDMAAQEPFDNIFIDGRDDDLLIKRRNFLQAPYKSYGWRMEPGYLLAYTPTSKNQSNKKQAISNTVAGWLEEDKEYVQGQIDRSQSGAGVLGDVLEIGLEQSLMLKAPTNAGASNPLDRPTSSDGLMQEEFQGTDPKTGSPIYRMVVKEKIDTTKKVAVMFHKQGTQPSKFVLDKKSAFFSAALDNTGRIRTEGSVIADPKEYIPTVEKTPKDIAGVGINRQSEQEMNLNCASATVLGDPELVCSRIVTILGVTKKHSGNHYIVSVEHEITPDGGYLCYLEVYRTGPNKLQGSGNQNIGSVEAASIGVIRNVQTIDPSDGTTELISVPLVKD